MLITRHNGKKIKEEEVMSLLKKIRSCMDEKLEKVVEKKIKAKDFEGAIKTASKISPNKRDWSWSFPHITQAAIDNKDFNSAIKSINLQFSDDPRLKEQATLDLMVIALKSGNSEFAIKQASSINDWLAIAEATKDLATIKKTLGMACLMSNSDVEEQGTILAKLAEVAADAKHFDLAWQITKKIVLDYDGANVQKIKVAKLYVIKAVATYDIAFARKCASEVVAVVEKIKPKLNKEADLSAWWIYNSSLTCAIDAYLAISRVSKQLDDLKIVKKLIMTNDKYPEEQKEKLEELKEIQKSL